MEAVKQQGHSLEYVSEELKKKLEKFLRKPLNTMEFL